MNREKICHWINTSEKLKEGSCSSCVKDTKRYYKIFAKASKGVFAVSHSI